MMAAVEKFGATSIEVSMSDIGARARVAARAVALAPTATKDAALAAMAAELRRAVPAILAANAQDVADGEAKGLSGSFIDRLVLNEDRIEGMAAGLEAIAALPDPVGRVLSAWDRPNGLHIERVATPLGVIGIIYESRPNVTADAGALCLKSGNAAILRGGSDALRSSSTIVAALRRGLASVGLPEDAIQLVPTTDRAAVGAMLTGLGGAIDVIVPRGGKSLVARVQTEARVPVFSHLEGICHVYVDAAADLAMAEKIVVNAKMRRTGICGAAETLLVDRACAATHLLPLVEALRAKGCEIRASAEVMALVPGAKLATEADWSTEYLDAIITVGLVDGVDGAIAHIEHYGSHHTEAIVTDDAATAARFLNEIDSAILLWNASTQFADGGEFGMGAEIGIATGKMHARGPVGVDQLVSFNYRVRGNGQTRP
ncbi:glutamate-5-semialdehyde dehydrogenase [Pinisolibacter aquiterrae]|uniref:glutamate-5-semialdehyde dehydrogenase n=1 Tax=Pinisolibacter aquiterrae TaxID=2815579 RepID=UPI001C3E4997|nr:glutamate-5-semialdehyde dehydrogenase [Pinisolibacter aquiterrae]MBV5264717.1 glutamate-5-semialdehyde dehydrogenase [Pinisolibacter aquiterrae]MCC8233486.1 glutamate-5-semialdehyde dehydrogenase [Pinisolibacter aquiterrae]